MDGVVSPEHRRRSSASSAASRCSTSRASGPATRTPTSSSSASPRFAQGRGHARDAGDLPRAGQAGADRPARSRRSRPQGVVAAASLTPAARARATTRSRSRPGSTSSSSRARSSPAEHVSTTVEPLNLKEFIREVPVPVVVGGCACYHTGLHLMRTGAAGVLVGVGPGAACTTRGVLGIGVPQATAIADVAAARSQHMLETGEYVQGHRRRRHAQRRRRLQGDRLRRRRRDDRLAARPRLRGARPRLPLGHGDLPPDAAARRARAAPRRTARSRRSSSGPPARTTARSTSWAACAPRWRRAATRTSPSSTAPS